MKIEKNFSHIPGETRRHNIMWYWVLYYYYEACLKWFPIKCSKTPYLTTKVLCSIKWKLEKSIFYSAFQIKSVWFEKSPIFSS